MLTKNSEATRNNILSASKKLFWNQGYTNVSVRKIADEAKCDIALISRYFQNKKGLFEILLNKEFDDPSNTHYPLINTIPGRYKVKNG